MNEQSDGPATITLPGSAVLLALAILVPAVIGVYPVAAALRGLGFGPVAWVATSWQLASVVLWTLIAAVMLGWLRRRTDRNIHAGRTVLAMEHDGAALCGAGLAALIVHAIVLAMASVVLAMGRGRPALPLLISDIALIYAPMNLLTLLGLVEIGRAHV